MNDLVGKHSDFFGVPTNRHVKKLKSGRNIVAQQGRMNLVKVGKDDGRKGFYEQYGKCLEVDAHEDPTNKMKDAMPRRYQKLKSGDKLISSKDYVDQMKVGQGYLYDTIDESITAVSFCQKNGAFDVTTMGSVPNVGLMEHKSRSAVRMTRRSKRRSLVKKCFFSHLHFR